MRVLTDSAAAKVALMDNAAFGAARSHWINAKHTREAAEYPALLTDEADTLGAHGTASTDEDGSSGDDDDDDGHAAAAVAEAEAARDQQHGAIVTSMQQLLDAQKEEAGQLLKRLHESEALVDRLRKAELTKAIAPPPAAPSARGAIVTPLHPLGRANSMSGTGRRSTGARPVSQQSGRQIFPHAVMDSKTVAQEVVARLGNISGADKPPSAQEWAKVRRELRELQTTVTAAFNR
jgi:hypothetical protein